MNGIINLLFSLKVRILLITMVCFFGFQNCSSFEPETNHRGKNDLGSSDGILLPDGTILRSEGANKNSPYVPRNYNLTSELSDEFDDNFFDTFKWIPHFPNWGGHAPGRWLPENVSVTDGKLKLKTSTYDTTENGQTVRKYDTSAVHSLWRMKYGYYEIKARMARSRISSGFWLFSNDYYGNEGQTEIDIFEYSHGNYGGSTKYTINQSVHMWRTEGDAPKSNRERGDGEYPTLPFDPTDLSEGDNGFHIYSFLWTPEEMVWFVDGVRYRTSKTKYPFFDKVKNKQVELDFGQQPLSVIFDVETQEKWMGLPEPGVTNFEIDYIRVYSGPATEGPYLGVKSCPPGQVKC